MYTILEKVMLGVAAALGLFFLGMAVKKYRNASNVKAEDAISELAYGE